MLASQTSGLIERSPSRALRCCIPAIALTKDKTPIMTCTRTDRIVLVLAGLTRIRSGKFNYGLDPLRFGNLNDIEILANFVSNYLLGFWD